jgi:NADH-quinone oxidoreductase subunit G
MSALKDLMASLGSANLDCRQDGAALDAIRGATSTSSTRRIAGIERGRRASCSSAANPRDGSAGDQCAHPQAAAWRAASRSACVGAAADLDLSPSRRWALAARRWQALAAGTHPFAATLKAAKKPMLIIGQGALRARRRRGRCWRGLADRGDATVRCRTTGTASTCCTPPPAASAGSISASCRAGRRGVAGMLARREGRRALAARRRRDRHAASAGTTFVIYQGHHGDAGARRGRT